MSTHAHSGAIAAFIRIGTRICGRLHRVDPGEAFGRHPDDRHRVVVDENLLADDPRIAREAADPVVVAEHDHWDGPIDLVVFLAS